MLVTFQKALSALGMTDCQDTVLGMYHLSKQPALPMCQHSTQLYEQNAMYDVSRYKYAHKFPI